MQSGSVPRLSSIAPAGTSQDDALCVGITWGVMIVTQDTADEQSDAEKRREFYSQAVHLTRTMQVNTLTLSQMADQKASILIGATFVVFSLSITRLLGTEITYSTIALAATAFGASFFAVLTVLPKLGGLPSDQGKINPLFFGHFSALDEEQWTEDLLNRLANDELLFRTMLRDVYQNGQVLYRRKYRYLGYAYRTFIGGLLATMLIYIAEYADLI